MTYYVLAQDGNRYGPVDVEGLRAWAGDGRLIPATQLEEAETGRRLAASEVPGLWSASPIPGYEGVPCRHCGALNPESKRHCIRCGRKVKRTTPEGLLTVNEGNDRALGFFIGLISPCFYLVGGLVALGMYFGLRQQYPVFCKGLIVGLGITAACFLGLLALCSISMMGA
jgi:hypothetical protein